MPTDVAAPGVPQQHVGHGIRGRYHFLIQDINRARIFRYALGVTLSMALANAIDWSLSFLTPLLCAVILAKPLPVPPLKAGLLNMAVTLLAFLFSFLFTLFLQPYPLIYSLSLALVLFNIYYFLNRGGSFWLVLMLLLSVLMMPLLSSISNGLAFGVVIGFVWSGWVTIFMVWLVHFLVPDPETVTFPKRPGFQPGYSAVAAQTALKSTVVVWPLALLFIANDWISQILVLIFAAIFTLMPDLEKGRLAGMATLASTLIGGVFAWLAYYLLVAVPEYFFFVILIFFLSLAFGDVIFSAKPLAKLYPSAMTTLIVLLDGSMDANSSFTETFFVRLGLILLATIYVVFALKLLHTYELKS
ncbi:MAG: DUF2955 domain-containing protein [Gammaproteobacteria bacterium]